MDASGVVILAVLVLALASFWPAARGHWLALPLSIPSILLGIMLGIGFLNEHGRVYPGFGLMTVVYLVLGFASVRIWSWRRRSKAASP